MKTYCSIFIDLRKNQREKNKIFLSLSTRLPLRSPFSILTFIHFFSFIIIIIIILNTWFILLHSGPFLPSNNLIFLVHFILNELSPSHFLTSDIFVQISSLKSLVTYHPENRKIFRLSQNLTKLFWVTRFCETNLTMQSVSSSEI